MSPEKHESTRAETDHAVPWLPEIATTHAPPGAVRLPAGLGDGVLVGRATDLDWLVETEDAASALVGLGGSGKTTLAWQFSLKRLERDNPVWWIAASTDELIEDGLAELATRLDPIFAGLPVPVAASWARRWLAAHHDWLLVLDDVEGPEQVRELIEELPHGRIVLTSRQSEGWEGLAADDYIWCLDLGESIELLEHVVRGDSPEQAHIDLTGAAELCQSLGGLPLAIEQAGAFIAKNANTPERYLRLLNNDGALPMNKDPLNLDSVEPDPELAVARIWRVGFDRLVGNPLAVQMLRVLAWFAPDDIPRGLGAAAGGALRLEAALDLLAGYRLVRLTEDSISVHPLVQEIARTPSDEDPYRSAESITEARGIATALLVMAGGKLTGAGPEIWPERRKLFPHVEALAANSAPDQDGEHAATLFGWTGHSMYTQGDYRSAIRHLTRAVESFERLLGPSHAKTLRQRYALALTYVKAGESDRGVAMQREVLDASRSELGAEHELTLAVRVSWAVALADRGEYDVAIAELRALYEFCVAERGDQDKYTRLTGANLGGALSRAGQATEAVAIYDACYKVDLAVHGRDDASTLMTANNLASALLQAGQDERALPLFEDLVERRTRILGEDHPDSLVARSNLAVAAAVTGDLAGSCELYAGVLEARERMFGAEHPDTLATRENLDLAQHMLRATERSAARAEASRRRRGLLRVFRRT